MAFFLARIVCASFQLRTFGIALVGSSVSLAAFVSVKSFPIIIEVFDLHGCMMIFCVGSVLGAIFVLFVIDETTGKCLDDVGLDEKATTEREPTTRISSC